MHSRHFAILVAAAIWLSVSTSSHASFLSGDALDTMADWIAIFVLILVPAGVLVVFWLIHILPEKVAEKRHHPQKDAINTLCVLSLFFGGMLWPIAWLWAYSKPVLHKLAYGTDVDDSHAPPAGVGEEPEGTLPVLTTEAEVPERRAAVKPMKLGG